MSKPIYEHHQVSKLRALGILYLFAIVVILSLFGSEMAVIGVVSTLIGGGAVAMVILSFSRLAVIVDTDEVRLAFGFGFPRKRIARTDIVRHEVVRNSWLLGFGIRWIKGGRMWNVWGLDAVELVLANEKTFRIGTDEPEKLDAALRA
jgi:hypothetical protein